jgi:hypothetical protein
MSIVDTNAPDIQYCARHPGRETAVRCGKCGTPICTRCMIQTPVGMRCRECAQLRRLPQFEVKTDLLARAIPAGLAVSCGAWYVTSFVPFLSFWLGFLVGIGVGDVMSRLAKRRSNIVLEAAAVGCVIAGFFVIVGLRHLDSARALVASGNQNPAFQIWFLLPVVVACVMAVVRLR